MKEPDELEAKLGELNEELTKANEALQAEVASRQRAERALQQSEECYRLLMEYALEAVSVIQKLKDQIEGILTNESRKTTLIRAFMHDLKGPLALISSCAQFSMGDSELKPSLQENLKIIYESSQRAGNLLKTFWELFEFKVLPLEPTDINDLVTKTWQTAQLDFQAHQVAFESQLEEKLPKIPGNAEELQRVFYNLFVNAIQALSRKGKVTARTRFLPEEKMVEVEVIDDGPGIPLDRRHKVFEPFYTTKEEGAGLGLAICLSIVQQHMGTIQIDGAPEGGTKVSVRLPAE